MSRERRAQQGDFRWWQKRGNSVLTLVAVIVVLSIAVVALVVSLSGVLGNVGQDAQGDDPWTDPVGVEKFGELQLVRVPICASAPVVKVALWDENSEPYWEATGPPSPLATFVVGIAPDGFTDTVAFKEPPPGAVLRVVVVRALRGVAGARYTDAQLRTGFVVSGPPTQRYATERYVMGSVCGQDQDAQETTETTTPG